MEKQCKKQCKKHGLTEHSLNGKKYKCNKCQVDAVKKRRDKIKQLALLYKGGKCEKCGYDKCIGALEFHHTDSDKKEFGISQKGYTRSWKKVQEELDKCKILCANCHRQEHYKEPVNKFSKEELQKELHKKQQ